MIFVPISNPVCDALKLYEIGVQNVLAVYKLSSKIKKIHTSWVPKKKNDS